MVYEDRGGVRQSAVDAQYLRLLGDVVEPDLISWGYRAAPALRDRAGVAVTSLTTPAIS